MPHEGQELTRFQKMERSWENVPIVAFFMQLSTWTKSLAVLIAAIVVIATAYQWLFDRPTPREPVVEDSGAGLDPPPVEDVKHGDASKGRRSRSTDAPDAPASDAPDPPDKPILANRLTIAPPSPGNTAGPRWTFVATGRSASGYLYPYVIDETNGGRFVGPPLRSNGEDSWLGNAPIGNNDTKSGATYSVSVVWSEEPIPTGRIDALPHGAALISNPVTVTRR